MIEHEPSHERRIETGGAIDAAQAMTDWFPDYLYGVIDVPGELPQLTVDRLRRQFGAGRPTQQLEQIRDALMMFDQQHQANLASYFCGFPEDVLELFEDEETIHSSVRVLDEMFPPQLVTTPDAVSDHLTGESRQEYLARVLREGEAARLARRQTAVGKKAVPLMLLNDPTLAWQADALCAQTDPEAFFPEKGGSTRDAKKICETCEVTEQCLDYAMKNEQRFGIWGGLSERERRKYEKTGVRPEKQPRKNAAGREKALPPKRVEPFRLQGKRIEHFVELVTGAADIDLFDAYNERPEQMARTAHALFAEIYPDKDDKAAFARRRRVEVYFLHKKWNRLQDEFGGAGKYWDLLTSDLTEVFARVAELKKAYDEEGHDISFAEYYLQQGMAGLEILESGHEFFAPSFTSVHVLPRPKPKENEVEEDAQEGLAEKKAI